MILGAKAAATGKCSKPRASGDDPWTQDLCNHFGWVNPARAGMIRIKLDPDLLT